MQHNTPYMIVYRPTSMQAKAIKYCGYNMKFAHRYYKIGITEVVKNGIMEVFTVKV